MSTNVAVLTGRLTREVDLRYTATGIAVGNISLAVERNYTNAEGEYETDFINGVIWRNQAENLASFTTKGSLITIQGEIQSGSYENKEGQKINTTEIKIDNFQALEPKAVTDERRNNAQGGNSSPKHTSSSKQSNNSNSSAFKGNKSNNNDADRNPFEGKEKDPATNISDDDLPF